MQAIAARLGASVTLASVEELPREYDLTENKFTRQIQENLDYDMRSDPRLVNRARNVMGGYGGFLTCRDVLVTGRQVFEDIRSFGAVCMDSMKVVLEDKVPELPFLDNPEPSFAALFCTDIHQIHFGATGSWNSGYPTERVTLETVLANPGHYRRDVVRTARAYTRDFYRARKEVVTQQKKPN